MASTIYLYELHLCTCNKWDNMKKTAAKKISNHRSAVSNSLYDICRKRNISQDNSQIGNNKEKRWLCASQDDNTM